jgi:uncharacterized protein YciI
MKSCGLLFFVMGLIFTARSQQAADSLYLVTYTTGPSWDATKAPPEQQWFKEHSGNLGNWRKAGVIKLGARVNDKGIIVVRAASLEAARQLISSDEAVQHRLFNAEVAVFNVFYFGCLEREPR